VGGKLALEDTTTTTERGVDAEREGQNPASNSPDECSILVADPVGSVS
jgi:hypothetical protein